MTAYSRTCPRCQTAFRALTERGICPQCGLFSVIRPDGSFVATRALFVADEFDEPFSENPLADVYAAAAIGGAPLREAYRFEGFPAVDLCHAELRQEFQRLKSLIELELPDVQAADFADPSSHPDWAGSPYADALEVGKLTWDDEGYRFDLICSLTVDGGEIDLLRDGKMSVNLKS
jgi:hypothetical protein